MCIFPYYTSFSNIMTVQDISVTVRVHTWAEAAGLYPRYRSDKAVYTAYSLILTGHAHSINIYLQWSCTSEYAVIGPVKWPLDSKQ